MFIVETILHCCLFFYSVDQTVQVQDNHYQNDGNVGYVNRNESYGSDPSISGVGPPLRGVASACLGYELADNLLGYYKIHDDKQNWYNAKEVCMQENANLLIVNTQQEANSVRKLLKKKRSNHHYYWAGFHNINEEGNYVTIFNDSLNSTGFAVWGNEEPDGRSGENCGVFGSFDDYNTMNYTLGDWLCTIPLPYICEKDSLIQSSHEEGPSLEGYHLIPYVGYYKKHMTYKTWQEAVDICKEDGAHLIIIDSVKEQDAVWDFLKETESYMFCFWVGVHDHYDEGNFVTIFNKTVEYYRWFRGLATGGDDKNCLDFCYATYSLGSSDENCNYTKYFICEHEI